MWFTFFSILLFTACFSLQAQDCNIEAALLNIKALEEKGAFIEGLTKAETLLECSNISSRDKIALHTWMYKFHRNQLKNKRGLASLIKAIAIQKREAIPSDLDFNMLLAEAYAL